MNTRRAAASASCRHGVNDLYPLTPTPHGAAGAHDYYHTQKSSHIIFYQANALKKSQASRIVVIMEELELWGLVVAEASESVAPGIAWRHEKEIQKLSEYFG